MSGVEGVSVICGIAKMWSAGQPDELGCTGLVAVESQQLPSESRRAVFLD